MLPFPSPCELRKLNWSNFSSNLSLKIETRSVYLGNFSVSGGEPFTGARKTIPPGLAEVLPVAHGVFVFVFFCAHRGTNTKLQTKTGRGKLIHTRSTSPCQENSLSSMDNEARSAFALHKTPSNWGD